MKTQTYKRNIKISVVTIFTSIIFLSCYTDKANNNQNENESTEEIENTEETIEEEVNKQIIENLDNTAFKQYLNDKDGILIDVRTAEEHNKGHIEGSINYDFLSGAFEASLDSLDKDKTVFVYCQGGGRSGKARDLLKENNFKEIYNLENGYGNWTE